MGNLVEAVLSRPKWTMIVVVVALPLACWVWVVAMARDMYGPMTGASAWMMTVTWDAPRLVLLWAMWAAMMAGMMLPTITPLLMLYARAVRNRPNANPSLRIYAMALGYLLVWALFSVGATVLQRALASASLLTTMMEPASSRTAAVLLFACVAATLPASESSAARCDDCYLYEQRPRVLIENDPGVFLMPTTCPVCNGTHGSTYP